MKTEEPDPNEPVRKAEIRADLRMTLANATARRIKMEQEERRLKRALDSILKMEMLGEKRSASKPVPTTMRSQPKVKADSGHVWQTEEQECDHGEEAELLERLTLEEKARTLREQESVHEMILLLKSSGCTPDYIQMEVEMKHSYFAKQKIEELRASGDLPQEESEEEDDAELQLCVNGCGRPASEGFEACCRICIQTSGRKHGPICRMTHGPNDPNFRPPVEKAQEDDEAPAEEPAEPEGKDR